MPSTPGVSLDVITGNIPITLWLEEESAKGALRLKNLNHWQHPPSGKLSMRLTSHITTGTPHITEFAKGGVRLMGQGDWTLESAPSGKGIIKVHSTLSNNFLHTLNINKHDSWDITKPTLVLDHSYTITYPTAFIPYLYDSIVLVSVSSSL